ncbi:MAG: enoyl-CoA hydratase/isomerase family protein [Pseudomonadota bacterium]
MLQIKQHADGIREIRLARPPVNALNPALMADLKAKLDESFNDGSRAVVLSGAPGLFSAGLDVPELLTQDRDGMIAFWTDLFGVLEALAKSPIPVVSAMTGHSPAGGTVIAIFADYRIMAEGDFKLGLNEVQVGLTVPKVIHQGLVRLLGPYAAERHLVQGQMISAADALELGLVDATVPVDQVIPQAIDWCRQHLALPSHSLLATRAICRTDLAALFDQPNAINAEAFVDFWFSEATQASLQALVANLKKAS